MFIVFKFNVPDNFLVDRLDPQLERKALAERVTHLEATVSTICADVMISEDFVKNLEDNFTKRFQEVDADFQAIRKDASRTWRHGTRRRRTRKGTRRN